MLSEKTPNAVQSVIWVQRDPFETVVIRSKSSFRCSRHERCQTMNEIFISYARENRDFAAKLEDRLRAAGAGVWRDENEVRFGDDWLAVPRKAIIDASSVVFLISKHSVTSEPCRKELEYAVEYQKRIITVLLGEDSDLEGLPKHLGHVRQIVYIDFSKPQDFDRFFPVLQDEVRRDTEADRIHNMVLRRADDWNEASAPKRLLLQGADLRRAVWWKAAADVRIGQPPAELVEEFVMPTALEREYIQASQGRDRLRRQRFAIWLIVIVMAGLTAVFGGNRLLNVASARHLTTEAQAALLQGRYQSAALLAIRANRDDPTQASRVLEAIPYQADMTRGVLLQEHADKVTSVTWRSSGYRLASGSLDGRILVWDMSERKVTAVLEDDGAAITDVAWHPDGQHLASSAADGTVQIWNVSSKSIETTVGYDNTVPVTGLAWSPDGALLAIGFDMGIVIVWDAESKRELHRLRTGIPFPIMVNDLAWQPNGDKLAAAIGNSVFVWNANSGQLLRDFNRHDDQVWDVDWSPDGKSLASGAEDGRIIVWRLVGSEPEKILMSDGGAVYALAWHPDGRKIASSGFNVHVSIWDLDSEKIISKLEGHTHSVSSMEWHPVTQQLVSGAFNGELIIWHANSEGTAKILDGTKTHHNQFKSVAWDPTGQFLASASAEPFITVWRAETGESVTTIQDENGTKAVQLAWSPDGRYLATASSNGFFALWDSTGTSIVETAGWGWSQVRSMAWRPQSDIIAFGMENGQVVLWTRGEGTREFTQAKSGINGLAWNQDGSNLAFASEDSISLWSLEQEREITQLREEYGEVRALAWQQSGTHLASGDDSGRILIWDVNAEVPIAVLEGHQKPIRSLAWHPKDNTLASGAEENRLIIWDTDTRLP